MPVQWIVCSKVGLPPACMFAGTYNYLVTNITGERRQRPEAAAPSPTASTRPSTARADSVEAGVQHGSFFPQVIPVRKPRPSRTEKEYSETTGEKLLDALEVIESGESGMPSRLAPSLSAAS